MFFHASLKDNNRKSCISSLIRSDRSTAISRVNIENEIPRFMKLLWDLQLVEWRVHVDIVAMRSEPQLCVADGAQLNAKITETEICKALKDIGELKAPEVDGYNSKFFKASWIVIKLDVVAAVRDFFLHSRLYVSINTTLVTLIPKFAGAKTVREYRPISCCIIVFKIVSEVLTARLSKVLGKLIYSSQVAFVPGQHIQDHIRLA